MRTPALAAAVLAAAFFPGHRIGLSAFLVAAVLGVAVWNAGISRRRALLYGVPALALVAICVIRDATWIVMIDIAVAWVLAAVAVSGPNLSAFVAPFARLVETPTLAPPLPSGSSAAIRGTVLGGLLMVPFGALFWTADAAFAELGQQVPFPEPISLPGRVLAFVLVLGVGVGLCLAVRNPFPVIDVKAPVRLSFFEWLIPLSLLNALFAAFVIVQFAVLFGGHDHVLETAGLTYSEYAHQGFWQLVAAAALTLTVVGAALLFTNPLGRRQRALRDALLAMLCLFTLVVLASALRRLDVYEDAYGLSRLRLAVDSVVLWLGGLFVLVLAAGIVGHVRRHFVEAVLLGSAAALLALSSANPDRIIAGRNIERWRETGKLDVEYLGELSADAAPAIAELPPSLEAVALAPLRARLAEPDPWFSYNVSRARARAVLSERSVVSGSLGYGVSLTR
jgi:hypothetical protein